jgi:hypothetical protein
MRFEVAGEIFSPHLLAIVPRPTRRLVRPRGGQVVEYGRSFQIPAGIAFYFWGLIFYNHFKTAFSIMLIFPAPSISNLFHQHNTYEMSGNVIA